jgi:RNA polymerase sigma factor (sigma-70 family)
MGAEASVEEQGLWDRARAGDAGARARIAELATEIARRELRRRGAARADLDDLVQESSRSTLVYLSGGGEPPRDLGAFLKFRAWGVLSDLRKRMRTQRTTSTDEVELEPSAPGNGPSAGIAVAEVASALADCRARLSPEQRVVLEMRYEGAVEAEVIASELGVHRNTVHVRVFRALQSLRECLQRKGYEAGDLA